MKLFSVYSLREQQKTQQCLSPHDCIDIFILFPRVRGVFFTTFVVTGIQLAPARSHGNIMAGKMAGNYSRLFALVAIFKDRVFITKDYCASFYMTFSENCLLLLISYNIGLPNYRLSNWLVPGV